MQAKYERLSITEIAAIVDRLAAAMQAPRCSNRAAVTEWWWAASQAYDVAMGWR